MPFKNICANEKDNRKSDPGIISKKNENTINFVSNNEDGKTNQKYGKTWREKIRVREREAKKKKLILPKLNLVPEHFLIAVTK